MKYCLIFNLVIIYSGIVFNLNAQIINGDYRIEDRFRILDAMKISDQCFNGMWENSGNVPFAIILVTDSNEYLINHDNPTGDFRLLIYDSLLKTNIYTRPRIYSNNSLATFPAVNGLSTIVIGQPENTSRSGFRWILTLLHEHLHQYQAFHPDYYESVNALELSGGDSTGMWMLNYDFPYEDKIISEKYYNLTQSAKKTYLSGGSPVFKTNLDSYLNERNQFKLSLSEKDYAYFSFQIWQEGIARYTEAALADCIKESSDNFREMNIQEDFKNPDSLYSDILQRLIKRADTQILSGDKRNCFYTLGALEGLILDYSNPEWRKMYIKNKFYIEDYFIPEK